MVCGEVEGVPHERGDRVRVGRVGKGEAGFACEEGPEDALCVWRRLVCGTRCNRETCLHNDRMPLCGTGDRVTLLAFLLDVVVALRASRRGESDVGGKYSGEHHEQPCGRRHILGGQHRSVERREGVRGS